MSVTVWRIAQDTRDYAAEDLSGRGAEITGGRWNSKGTPMVYASSSRALACLETLAHFNAGGLPLNRYLVEITIPDAIWSAARKVDAQVGWDAEPASRTSIPFGDNWCRSRRAAIMLVPSVIVPEEMNVLINPRHANSGSVAARKLRKWLYDPRLTASGRP